MVERNEVHEESEYFMDYILVVIDRVDGHTEDRYAVKCPMEEFYHEETGEDASDRIEYFNDEIGGADEVKRIDWDKVRYVINGEPYIGEYNMNPAETI